MSNNRILLITLLIISLMLVIISSWNIDIFRRLKNAMPKYTSDDIFNNACLMSKNYVIIGYNISIIMLIISVLLMIFSSFIIQLKYIPNRKKYRSMTATTA